MGDVRRISGRVTLQCNSDGSHQWEEKYSVRADDNGNPDLGQLNFFLKQRKVKCPHCGCISFKIVRPIIVTTVHS